MNSDRNSENYEIETRKKKIGRQIIKNYISNKDLPCGESDRMQEIARGGNFNIYCLFTICTAIPQAYL